MTVTARIVALMLGSCFWWVTSRSLAETPTDDSPATSEYETARLRISWQARPTCGDARFVAELVRELLGNEQVLMGRAHAQFDVMAVQRGFHVVLRFTDGARKGHRTFDVESCEAALDASTLVLAVALRPNMPWEAALARLTELRNRSGKPSTSQAIAVFPDQEAIASESMPPLSVAPQKSEPLASESHITITKGRKLDHGRHHDGNPAIATSPLVGRVHTATYTLLDTATLPSRTGGFVAGVGVDVSSLFVGVTGVMLLPRGVSLPDDSSRRASVRFVGGSVRVCTVSRAPDTNFSIRPCTAVILATISADAFGGATRHRDETYVAATIGTDAAFRVRRDVSIIGGIDLAVPVRRVSVVFDGNGGELYRTSPALQAWLGVDWSF